MEGPACPTLYNEILKIGPETSEVDAFRFGIGNGGLVPDRYTYSKSRYGASSNMGFQKSVARANQIW